MAIYRAPLYNQNCQVDKQLYCISDAILREPVFIVDDHSAKPVGFGLLEFNVSLSQ